MTFNESEMLKTFSTCKTGLVAAALSTAALPHLVAGADAFSLPAQAPGGPAWARGAVLYQLNLHNYTPEGTIVAAQRHLPRLANLGVDVVWLMPVHPRGQMKPRAEFLRANGGASPVPVPEEQRDTEFRGNPYCPRDHTEIDPLLGNFADLKRFTDAAHALGMKVMLGWVPNHTSWDSLLLAQHPDWYLRDPKGRVKFHAPWEPIARLSYADRASGLWEYMLQARRKFVEQGGVDGFREDVAGKTPVEHWKWLRPRLDPDNRLLMLVEADETELLGPLDMLYDWQLPAVYWRILDGGEPATILDDLLREQRAKAPEGSVYLRYLFNHDQTGAARGHYHARHTVERIYGAQDGPAVPRHSDKFGVALPALWLLNAILPGGRPLIFMGQEIGFYGGIPHNRVQGFDIPFGAPPSPALPAFYRDAAALCARPAVYGGSFRKLATGRDDKVYAFERELDGERVIVAANLSKTEAQPVTLPPGTTRSLADATPQPEGQPRDATVNDNFDLPAGGYRVFATPARQK